MAEPFHCDVSQRLQLSHLGNHMLNAADFHASAHGFGSQYLLANNRAWVLSRLAIELSEMPPMYGQFNIETWVSSAMRYFTERCFVIASEQGQPYGYGNSVWALIDTSTRQPTNILDIDNGSIVQCVMEERKSPIDKPGRMRIGGQASFVHSIDTYYSDVDINGHINSVKYIEHILNLWPLDWHRQHQVSRFEIAYVAEAHQGDRLTFYRERTETDEFCIRVCRMQGDEVGLQGNEGPVEVVRSKVIFREAK